MTKIAKLIKACSLLIKNPSLINLIVESESRWENELRDRHSKYTTLPVVEIDALIPDFNEQLHSFTFLGGGSMPTDIMLLQALARQIKDGLYFEIGTWRGESVCHVAPHVKEAFTLNLSSEEILELGMPKGYADLHGFFSKDIANVTHLYGNSLNYNFKALGRKFDLIFIDGNHKYDFVKSDTQNVFEHLVKEDTIVVWHDYAFDPENVRAEVLLGILDGIPSKFKDNLYHVSNSMCAIYCNKKLVSSDFSYPIEPNKVFDVKATLKKL